MTHDQDEHAFPYYRSPKAIREEGFTHRMRGLDEAEVREYLDLLADQVQATDWERHELTDELARLRAENEQLRSARPPAPEPPRQQPAPAATSTAAANAHAAAVMAQAQEVADQLVAEAARQAQQMIAQAQVQGRAVVRQARDRAQGQLTAVFDALDGDFERIGRSVGQATSSGSSDPRASFAASLNVPPAARDVVRANPVVVRHLNTVTPTRIDDPLTSPHW